MYIYSHLSAKVAERLRNRLQICTSSCAGSKRFYSGSNPDLGLVLIFFFNYLQHWVSIDYSGADGWYPGFWGLDIGGRAQGVSRV